MDQMLRDGEWYQAQERADALRAILGDDANADVQAIEEALHEAIKQFGPQRLAKALAEYAPGETASVDRSRQRT